MGVGWTMYGPSVRLRVNGAAAPMVLGRLREHRATGHDPGQRQHSSALGHERGHAGSASPGERLECSRSAARPGAPDGPAQQWAGDDGGGRGPDRCPRSIDQSTHRAAGQTQRGRELVVARAVEGRADEDLSLELGERRHSGERGAGLDSLFDHLVDGARVGGLRKRMRNNRCRPYGVEAHVVRYPIEPRPGLSDLGAGGQGFPGLEEGLLHGVLGAARTGLETSAVCVEFASVAAYERLEGRRVTVPSQRNQTPVGLRLQKPQ
jgi:hypothetical protein